MNLVEQVWEALYFVDDDPSIRSQRPHLGSEEGGICQQTLVVVFAQQVYHVGRAEDLAQPGSLA